MILNSIDDTIERLLVIADVLYSGEAEKGIGMMSEVIPDLASMMELLDEELRQQFISEIISPILQAMESKDAVSLADIIKYELVELLRM